LSYYNNDEEKRWLFAIKAIDYHLDLFTYSLIQKRDLLKNLSTNFKSEFVNSKGLNSSLNDKFRENKKIIEIFMEQD
ncbi:lantibiotic dehydratase C-terminal domain-containing protein, partial [Pseudomonas sp. SIMBA_041]